MIKSQLNVVFANEKLKSPMTELLWLCVHPCSIEGVLITDNTVLSMEPERMLYKDIHEQVVSSIFECTQLHNCMQHFGPVGPMCATNGTKNYHPFVIQFQFLHSNKDIFSTIEQQ